MKAKFWLVGCLVSMLVSAAPTMARSKDNSVELGMLDKSLEAAEGTAVDAFAHKENRIEIDQTDVKKYDDFFKDVAVVSGTMTEMRFVLKQINGGKVSAADAMPVISFGLTALPEMESKIPALIDRAEAFDPAADFPGFRNKMKIPGVVSGLADATKTLTKSAEEAPEILKELRAISTTANH